MYYNEKEKRKRDEYERMKGEALRKGGRR